MAIHSWGVEVRDVNKCPTAYRNTQQKYGGAKDQGVRGAWLGFSSPFLHSPVHRI